MNPIVLNSKIGGRAETMQTTRLPFYDVQKIVLRLSEIPQAQSRAADARTHFMFSIPAEWIPFLTYQGDPPLPRYELQMRMFLLDVDMEQTDDFPPNCVVRINNCPVPLPSIIPTNKPNAEQKRYSRPVDITSFCQPNKRNAGQHRLEIDWYADRRTWAVGIWVVHRLHSKMLLDRMMNDTTKRKSIESTKKMISIMLDGDDDNIALDQLIISLLDPLLKRRMSVPTRTKSCNHLQCFDLYNYLMMNEKRPSWKCPQCPANGHYDNLVIDEYFMDLLSKADEKVTEVELLRDGSWKVTETNDEDDFSDDERPVKRKEEDKPKLAKFDDDIIILSSDDEDVAQSSSKKSKSSSGPPSKSRRKNSSSESSSSSSESSSEDERRRKTPVPPNSRSHRTMSSTDVPLLITLSDDEPDEPSVAPSIVPVEINGSVNHDDSSSTVTSSAPPSNGSGPGNENSAPHPTVNGFRTPASVIDETTQTRLMMELEEELARGMAVFVNNCLIRKAQAPFPFNTS